MRVRMSLPAALLLLVATGTQAASIGGDAGDPDDQATGAHCKAEPIYAPAAAPHFQFWWRHPAGSAAVPFQLHIAKDGTITDVRALPGEYHRDFAFEALKAIRNWKYKPLECGPPGGIWVQGKMIFQAPEEASNNSSKPKRFAGRLDSGGWTLQSMVLRP